jgi:hypothetical protein
VEINQSTTVYEHVDRALFLETIKPRARPAILRGLVGDWPATRAGRTSPAALADYLRPLAATTPAPYFEGASATDRRFFYTAGLDGFNFEKKRAPVADILGRLLKLIDTPDATALYAGALNTASYFPAFSRANALPGLIDAPAVLESIWIGNDTVIAPHYDNTENIACVVAGRRRFTLFPIEQYPNMYVGPLDFTPAGQPISLVDTRHPDFETFPRFRHALEAAEVAELEAGDAIYIPTLWWHGVESLTSFGMLVNYWWRDVPGYFGACMNALLFGALSLKDLPAAQRQSWKAVFDYLIFQTDGPPLDHLPKAVQGIFGDLTAENAAKIRAFLAQNLTR